MLLKGFSGEVDVKVTTVLILLCVFLLNQFNAVQLELNEARELL
jgi:hypothetical protein